MKTVYKLIIAVTAAAAAGGVAVKMLLPKNKVTINCNLTPDEYERICGEFDLKPDSADMEYIYRRHGGRNGIKRFGVRLAHDKLHIDGIADTFTIPIIKERLPEILRRKRHYPASDSSIVKASSFTPAAKRGNDYKVHIFKQSGCNYMEIEKPETDNIGIFLNS